MTGKNKRKRNNKKNEFKKSIQPQNVVNEDVDEAETGGELDESAENESRSSEKNFNENDEDSDTEGKPKRKKKKKQPVVTDSSDKKGKKSIRQMKKEKHAQRTAEMQAASKDQLKAQCISYLSQWKHDKQNWKFMKAKQVWLYKNKFSSSLIPDSSWATLLEYFESAQGNIRNLLLEDANKVINQMDEWTEKQKDGKKENNENNEEAEETEPDVKKPDDTAYKRARDLIQCLN